MALYRYKENISPYDRYEQLTILLDSGESLDMRMGRTYDLTDSERLRASKRIVLVPSSTPPSGEQPMVSLPVIGELVDGDIPIWDESLGAFVPGSGSEPIGNARVLTWNEDAGTYEPSAFLTDTSRPREFVGPTDPFSLSEVSGPAYGDRWTPTEEPVA